MDGHDEVVLENQNQFIYKQKRRMTENKKTIEKYMQGFRASDHSKILSCLTDDIYWEMPGFFL